jgi:sugar lactone lactonase YvrE
MRIKRNLLFLLGAVVLSVIAACGISVISSYSISGTVTQNGTGLSGVTVSLTGTSSASATTDVNGNYSFAHVANGSYTITPSFSGYTFSPPSSSQTVSNSNISGVNFTTSGSTAVVKTLAGSGTAGFADGAGNLASFNLPGGITTDGTNLYVADTGNNLIRQVVITSGQVMTLAGSTTGSTLTPSTLAPGTTITMAANSSVLVPSGTTIKSPTGNTVTVNGTSNTINTTAGTVVSVPSTATGPANNLVSTATAQPTAGFANGAGKVASFRSPNGITTFGTNLYVADTGNHSIRYIVISSGQVFTLTAGTGTPGFADGAGNSAFFSSPNGITTDGTNLYVADTGNNAIRQVVIASGLVSTLAGSRTAGFADGAGNSASFNSPVGITISPDKTKLYVADTVNNLIRQVVISSGLVTTIAGSGTPGFADGATNAAYFSSPNGIATDGTNLYVADTGNHRVRQVVIATGLVTTLAGSGTASITDGIGTAASFDAPLAITIAGTNLYVTDSNAIRGIQLQ